MLEYFDFKDVVFCDEDEDVGDLPDPSEKFEELLSRFNMKQMHCFIFNVNVIL